MVDFVDIEPRDARGRRRQGAQPRRDDPGRAAGPARLLRDHTRPIATWSVRISTTCTADWARRTSPDGLAPVAAEARDRVRRHPGAGRARDRIVDRYRASAADEAPVAVRSSATAEDLAYASFAGQQDTYLNVVGADALVAAVRGCWASLWTERAVNYRNANGIDHRSVTLAVVVQEMVEATAAGVMFTANPLTGTRHETVIDASPGLGEAVVSGAVNPDHYVVDTKAWSIIQRRMGDKRVVIRGRAGGGTERIERSDQSEAAALDDDQVLALARLGGRVDDHYGSPQDTEWALADDGAFWLTQARPITTLYPTPASPLSGDSVVHVPDAGAGADPADHPDGPGQLPADRRRRSRARRGGRPRTAAPDPSRSASPVNASSWI